MFGIGKQKMKKPAFGNTPTDISVHNKIEQAHREWMSSVDAVKDHIFLHDKEFRILRCNKAYQQCAGLPFKQIIGQPYYEVFPKTHEPLPSCQRAMEKEEEEVTVGGAIYLSRAFSIHDEQGAYLYSVHTLENITERKQAEVVLRSSEAQLRTVVENLTEGLAVSDLDGQLLHFNRAALDLHGFTTLDECRQHLSKFADTFELSTMDGAVLALDQWPLARVLRGENLRDLELYVRHIQADWRRVFNYGGTLVRDADGQPLMAIVTISDITGRKQAEVEIRHANRALATLGAVNHTLVHATDENNLLQVICQAIVEQRGYRMVWVGYVQHDESKSIKIMARAGHYEGNIDAMHLTYAETGRGMMPCGRAIRSGTTQLCQEIANDPQYLPWRDKALKNSYAASIALPLLDADNTVFGTLSVYSNEVNAFSPAEVSLLEEMAGDLAFGVRTLHTRHERDLALVKNQEQLVQLVFQNEEKEKRAAELAIANKELVFQNEEKEKRAAELTTANKELQDSLEDTVRAIATIGEMRDPYTAGHQVRVADLATAIAKQLGLPKEQVHAIHLAGVVHDLGKIQIPAEILSKPGKITAIEFSLIKIHPQAGYDILKGIDFPWPIAQMVLQHHERLDGSGYPQGLKGDDILLEARILSVADVVEAMSSHRPYRPGLGIEVALAEITKQRGIYFDPAVVDACLALFREQGYVLLG